MNRENEKQSVLIKTFEGTALDEISAEYNLPDYLPDINRLLARRQRKHHPYF